MKRAIAMTLLAALPALAQVEPAGSGSQPGDLDGGQGIDSAYTRCRSCHDKAISNDGDPLYMPFDGWVSTMMGNSIHDPLFQAAVSVANQDVPGVGSWCLRCHSPAAYVKGDTLPADGSAFDDIDKEGVSCEVCHRAKPNPDSGVFETGNAQIFFERTNTKYGPYPDMQLSPAHQMADAGFTGESALCGNCHQVENPLVTWKDSSGKVLGPRFPLDTTYDEWKQSQYAQPATLQSCQDCHMPRTIGDDGGTQWYVAKFGVLRDSPRRHTFVGGNLWGLQAVQHNGVNADGGLNDQFAQTTHDTEKNLQSAATLELTVEDNATVGGSCTVHVRVTNKTGHKLPTGYADGRRMVLQLVVNGEVHTGNFDGGQLIEDGWLHEYKVDHGKAGVGSEQHLAEHDMIVFDSRLPPAGFTPPVGAATRDTVNWYDLPDGGFKNYDDVTWEIDVPPQLDAGSTLNFVARLLYQSTTPDYVSFLVGQNHSTDAGQILSDIYTATETASFPFEMVRADAGVTVHGPAVAGTGGGAANGGGTASNGGGSDSGKSCGCSSSPAFGLLALGVLLALRRCTNRS